MSPSPFDSVVFAGGGNRCLWQAAFYETVAPVLGIRPEICSGSSAGATIACLLFAGRAHAALEHFRVATRENQRNMYPLNALRGRPVFPHYAMYRRVITETIGPDGFERLKSGPEIRVQLTRLPRWVGPRAGVLLGLFAYSVEKALSSPVHPRAGHRVGFVSEVASVSDCQDVEELADLLLSSSCVPPFTPVLRHQGRTVLDGGVVENVPVTALGAGRASVLILLTRTYEPHRLPKVPGHVYVQPSRKLPISKFDYTWPEGLDDAWDLGVSDGEAFLARWAEADAQRAPSFGALIA